ncbi:deoxyguanosinetriphosphate triphosphohydrolase [Alteromonas sp. C1M14]|uniref:deoxyguanosinetriphosphate triphosphohydrolase n=1 Tax=Alteromonas sp. C1M14 TaxID=2841567 RepID=UPI001C098645|nr:deoxyguanosinetriphosphate triphosphohydrolase [Alteromonas sp. C1M14]MBU2976726.1 deoxyguanosinetriphosphate triphosphohydrolase [Alteromonas sp. C1M14]
MQISNNVAQLSFAFEGSPASLSRPRGWSYLLANSVAFKKDTPHSIRMQKPTEEQVPTWIAKLITSGQCKTIYVENLMLKGQDRDKIRMLCHRYAVSIVNLQVVNDDNGYALQNVVMGPW